MDKYYFPDEVNRDTRQLRCSLAVGQEVILFQSELPMLFTAAQIEKFQHDIINLWRTSWQQHRDARQREWLHRTYPDIATEAAAWDRYVSDCERRCINPQISHFAGIFEGGHYARLAAGRSKK